MTLREVSQDCVLGFICTDSINANYVLKVYLLEFCLSCEELNENFKNNFLQFSTSLTSKNIEKNKHKMFDKQHQNEINLFAHLVQINVH